MIDDELHCLSSCNIEKNLERFSVVKCVSIMTRKKYLITRAIALCETQVNPARLASCDVEESHC